MATLALQTVTDELRRRKGYIGSKGVFNCRPKRKDGVERPDLGWSQHAYADNNGRGNAEDLAIVGLQKQAPYVSELSRMSLEGYPVGLVLWAANRPDDHDDHIHVEGAPAFSGTPLCAGGEPVTTEGDTKAEDSGFWQDFWAGFRRGFERSTGIDPGGDLSEELDPTPEFDLLQGFGMRIVWGLLAVVVGVLTVVIILAAFKGDAIGKAIDVVT